MRCIYLDLEKKQVLVPALGFVNAKSTEGKAWLAKMKGRELAVIYLGDCESSGIVRADPHMTCASIRRTIKKNEQETIKKEQSKITKKDFLAYEKVRQSGRWNMVRQWQSAARSANLKLDQYWLILRHYSDCKKKWPIKWKETESLTKRP